MASHSMILLVLAALASCTQAGLIGHQAFVAPYASSFNAHHINHAVAHPLLAPAPVPVPVHHHTVLAAPAPAPAVLAAPAPAPAVVAAPAPVAFAAPSGFLPAPLSAPHLFPGHVGPNFLNAPAPLGLQAGLPVNYNLWK